LYSENDRIDKKGRKIGKLHYVHRLVWENFRGEIPEGKEMDHIDGDTSNNSLDNLQLITRRRNVHKYSEGVYGPSLRKKRDEIIKDYTKLKSYKLVADKWETSVQMIYRVVKDVYHKYDRKTKKTQTVRFNPNFTDAFTENDFRNAARGCFLFDLHLFQKRSRCICGAGIYGLCPCHGDFCPLPLRVNGDRMAPVW